MKDGHSLLTLFHLYKVLRVHEPHNEDFFAGFPAVHRLVVKASANNEVYTVDGLGKQTKKLRKKK